MSRRVWTDVFWSGGSSGAEHDVSSGSVTQGCRDFFASMTSLLFLPLSTFGRDGIYGNRLLNPSPPLAQGGSASTERYHDMPSNSMGSSLPVQPHATSGRDGIYGDRLPNPSPPLAWGGQSINSIHYDGKFADITRAALASQPVLLEQLVTLLDATTPTIVVDTADDDERGLASAALRSAEAEHLFDADIITPPTSEPSGKSLIGDDLMLGRELPHRSSIDALGQWLLYYALFLAAGGRLRLISSAETRSDFELAQRWLQHLASLLHRLAESMERRARANSTSVPVSPPFWSVCEGRPKKMARTVPTTSPQWHVRQTAAAGLLQQLEFPLYSTPAILCGDWLLNDICTKWPREVARELASFQWPLTDMTELLRLLSCDYACPRHVVVCEFTTAISALLSVARGEVVLGVDERSALVPGVHACLDFRDVLALRYRWTEAYLFPPCTHQVRSDTTARLSKIRDGRAFNGQKDVIDCFCVDADHVFVEQPDTFMPDYYLHPHQRFRPAWLGDGDNKWINTYVRGREAIEILTHDAGTSGHKRLGDFANAEARDRWRSSWLRFPNTSAAVVAARRGPPASPLDFRAEMERFAAAWYDAGHPVPANYLEPLSPDDRTYQRVRGQGDGRRVAGVVPVSRRVACDGTSSLPLTSEALSARLVGERMARACELLALTSQGIVLCLVALACQPLIFAATNGYYVIGAELDAAHQRASAVRLAGQWAAASVGALSAPAFLVGEYLGGPRLVVAPVVFTPPAEEVVRTPHERRRRARAGAMFAWCTVAALAGCVTSDPAARALAACNALRGPIHELADAASLGHSSMPTFRFGAYTARSIHDRPLGLGFASSSLEKAVASISLHTQWLFDALHDQDGNEHAVYLGEWADIMQPAPLADVAPGLLKELPVFADARLDDLAFAPIPPPPKTRWLDRLPRQEPAAAGFCPRSIYDLMYNSTRRRVRRWLVDQLEDLVCVRDKGDDCERSRPRAMAIGQSELVPQARWRVWDCREAPESCCTVLDYHASIDPTFNIDYLSVRLKDYPDRRLVSLLVEGVRFLADVELQSVFIPHLTSISKGYASVEKELHRLSEKDWYRFYASPPFWPMYFNGQGATARKLEPDRWRRTTEGGGPRSELSDLSGTRVLSLNEASRIPHVPLHFQLDDRAQMLEWLRGRQLPPSVEEMARLIASRHSKWGPEIKPTLGMVMRDLVVLRRAAFLLNEPCYLLGDDIKDYFNHFAIAVEDLWKVGIAFLAMDGDLSRLPDIGEATGDHLMFVSELRMGFGLSPNSKIAQDFSESLNFMFRQDMDEVEDPILEADQRPTAQAWLVHRRQVEANHGGHQRRLYMVHMYTDDNIIGVVGVHRCIRLLTGWRKLTLDVGLIMAIPEKRSLGTWALWLGVLIFATLGVVAVPPQKLLRATRALHDAIAGRLDFSEYRSLVGLLEHFRCINNARKLVMSGLYDPHRPTGASAGGPNALVLPQEGERMMTSLQDWLSLLVRTSGAAITVALRQADLAARNAGGMITVMSADAATDSDPPGLGGFCHGFFWYFQVDKEHLLWLHITVLELLATIFNAIMFADYAFEEARVLLQSDALATPYVLAEDSDRSEVLRYAHRRALSSPRYRKVAAIAEICQLYGDGNDAGDAVSRSLHTRFRELCRVLRVKPVELGLRDELRDIYNDVLSFAQQRGVQVRPNFYQSELAPLPMGFERFGGRIETPLEKGLSKRRRDVVNADGPPSLAQRLIERRCAGGLGNHSRGATTAPAPATVSTVAVPISKLQLRLLQRAGGGEPRSSDLTTPADSETASVPKKKSVLAERLMRRGPQGRAPLQRSHEQQVISTVRKSPYARPEWRRVNAGGALMPAPPGRQRAPTRRTQAMHAHAAVRADALAGPHTSDERLRELTELVRASDDMANFGAAENTLTKDDLAWDFWEVFCERYGWTITISAEEARLHPDRISQRLGLFMLWMEPKIKGRSGREVAKPDSVLQYPLAIIRVFERLKVPMPKAKAIQAEHKGLRRAYSRCYGGIESAPKRRQPMTREMWAKVEALKDGDRLPGRQPWSLATRRLDRTVLAMGRIMWRSGHRLGEFTGSGQSDNLNFLTRASVTFVLSGVVVVDPTPQQLALRRAGDVVQLAPCESKPDQFGSEHCPFPSILPYDGTSTCAAAALFDLEEREPCRGGQRAVTPLMCDEQGRAYTYSVLNTALHQVLTALFGATVAAAFSWHAIRIGLACALLQTDCPDAMIQLICRWASPDSLKAYRRLGIGKNIYYLDRALTARIDATQVGNLPALDRSDLVTGSCRSAEGVRVAQAALPATPPLPPTPARNRRGEWHVDDHAMVPVSVYPNDACSENGGAGWLARVVSRRGDGGGAIIRLCFVTARTQTGRPFEDVRLRADALQPRP